MKPKMLSLLAILSLYFSCTKENDSLSKRAGIDDGVVYQGYPAWTEDCSSCEDAIREVTYSNGMLHFKDYQHFFDVRNCLSAANERANDLFYEQWSGLNEDELENKEEEVQYNHEKTLDDFEIWYPGYKSLRIVSNLLESNWMDLGEAANVPAYPYISDAVEMTLVSANGKIAFGDEVFDIFDETNQMKSSSCKNLAANQVLYAAGGSYYFLARNSVFPWPWGTTVYSTTKSYKKNNKGKMKLTAKKIGLQGAGNMSTYTCKDEKAFFIDYVFKRKKTLTRSYTEWGNGSLEKNAYSSYHYYENLVSPGLFLWN